MDKRGNISLLVIFVLLASSLIALLAMNQIQHLLSYGAMTNNYFRAHYLAKAGLELALTETSLREAGFQMGEQQGILSGDAVVISNVLAGYEGFQPFFSVHLQARTNAWSGELAVGESMVIPLFLDSGDLKHKGWLTGVQESELVVYPSAANIEVTDTNAALLFGLFAFSGADLSEMVGMVTKLWTDLRSFWDDEEVKELLGKSDVVRKYLTLVNSSADTVALRISSSSPFAVANTFIEVQAHYGDTEVWLTAVLKEPFPSFLQAISNPEDTI